jgi:hypothetical protein
MAERFAVFLSFFLSYLKIKSMKKVPSRIGRLKKAAACPKVPLSLYSLVMVMYGGILSNLFKGMPI